MLYNILYGQLQFAYSTKLLLAVVEGLQSSHSISVLPVNVQAQLLKILDGFSTYLSRADPIVSCMSLTLLLAPLLSGTTPTVPALMARASAVSIDSARCCSAPPRPPREPSPAEQPTETAFAAHPVRRPF